MTISLEWALENVWKRAVVLWRFFLSLEISSIQVLLFFFVSFDLSKFSDLSSITFLIFFFSNSHFAILFPHFLCFSSHILTLLFSHAVSRIQIQSRSGHAHMTDGRTHSLTNAFFFSYPLKFL